MHRVLITEVLIEVTIAALVVMGARPELNAAFQVMQTGLLPGRQFPETLLPEYDSAAFAGRLPALLPDFPVFACGAPQGPVKLTRFTMIIDIASSAPHNPGLLPDAGALILDRFIYCL